MELKDIAFSIGQRVVLSEPDTEIDAIIRAVLFDAEGVSYRVSYWDGNSRKMEWVLSDEIRAKTKVTA